MSGDGIEVANVQAGTGSPSVVATLDLKLGGVVIRGCRWVKTRDGRTFLSLPSRKDRDTEQWTPIVELSQPLQDRAEEEARGAVGVGATARPIADIPF